MSCNVTVDSDLHDAFVALNNRLIKYESSDRILKTQELLDLAIAAENLENLAVKKQGFDETSDTVHDEVNSELVQNLPLMSGIKSATDLLTTHPELGVLKEDVRKVDEPGNTRITTFKNGSQIVFPSELALAAAASYYNDKYDIDITVSGFFNIKPLVEKMMASYDGDFQSGVLVNVDPGNDADSHFIPLVISRRAGKVDIVVLDSAAHQMQGALYVLSMAIENCQVTFVDHTKKRQADYHSCRNDAMLVVKNALKFEDFMTRFEKESKMSMAGFVRHASLPPFMSRTIQNAKKMKDFSPEEMEMDIRPDKSKKSHEKKSLSEHYQRYTHSLQASIDHKYEDNTGSHHKKYDKTWDVNRYLQEKGYSLICKAFSQLDDGNGGIDQKKKESIVEKHIFK